MTAFLVTAYLHNETVEGLDTSGPLAIALTMEKAKELVEQWVDKVVCDGMYTDLEEIETRCYKTYKAIDELGDTNIIDIVINEVEINTLL